MSQMRPPLRPPFLSPLRPLTLAFAQMDDPVFLGVVLRSVAWALVTFVVLGASLARATVVLFGPHHWLTGWLAGTVGMLGAALSAWLLFLPVASIIATLFIERVAVAVERRFYPGAGGAHAAPLLQQGWDGLVLGAQILALQVAALALTPLLPGVSVLLGWAIAAWAIGRGLFVAVAMRRIPRERSLVLYRSVRGAVLMQGLLIAASSLVPVLNLIAPVLGVAAMVHLFHSATIQSGATNHGGGLSLLPPV